MLYTKHCFGPKGITLGISKLVNRCFASLEVYMDISGNNVGNPGCLDWGYASGFASGFASGIASGFASGFASSYVGKQI